MNVAIVKYNAGNIYSVVNALRRMGIEPDLTDSPERLMAADRVIFPGQGGAHGAMQYLKERRLDEVIRNLRQPVFGICVGQQLLCRHSEEGDTDCIGVFDVDVRKFVAKRHEDKIPAMGWNRLTDLSSPLMNGISEGDYVYFVHSFYVPLCDATIATTDFIQPYSACLHKDNFYTAQFHPEKSGKVGARSIQNFLDIERL